MVIFRTIAKTSIEFGDFDDFFHLRMKGIKFTRMQNLIRFIAEAIEHATFLSMKLEYLLRSRSVIGVIHHLRRYIHIHVVSISILE